METMNERTKTDFYEAVSEVNINAESRMMTVCGGSYAGEKMIISAGGPVWMSDVAGFLSQHVDELTGISDNGLSEIDGTEIYSELLCSEKEVVICGAGHVSMPVISIAKMMGCRVTVIDDREQFVRNALDRGADEGLCMGFEEALAKIPGNIDTYFIIVTRGHSFDRECLLSIIKKPHAYIGMIGSRRKVAIVKQALRDAGTPEDIIGSVHTPIGLDIGAETPEEIAVAIMAEIIDVKNRRKRNFGFPRDIMKALLSDEREPAVLVTIVSKQGSYPRGVGTKMLVNADGSITGTVGGGLAEAAAIQKAQEMLAGGSGEEPSLFMLKVDMSGKAAEDEGMVCGGLIRMLMEVV